MKQSLSKQEDVSTRRSRRARKRVQDSNFVFIWFWIPDLETYLLARHVQRTFDEEKHENQMFSLSLVYCFFFFSLLLRSDSQQTTNKARYDAICVQQCPNVNIWGYGLRSKRFESSRLYSKIILGLQATKRWGTGLHGKNFRAPRLQNIPPVKFIKTTPGTRIHFRTCQQSPLKLRRIVENCFKWTWKNPKNFTCTIVSIAFVPWLTGASEWSLSVITPSVFMTAIICSVALIYVWKINPVNLKMPVREKININTAKVHYLSY